MTTLPATTEKPTRPVRTVKVYGAPAELFRLIHSGDCPDEILVEGPAGTGKSFGICLLLIQLCETYPGIRVLMARKTLTSMRDTILPTLEKAFPKGHPAIARSHRNDQHPRYRFRNKSEITCASFESDEAVEKVKSSDYDIVYINEGTDITVNDWEIVMTRLRNGVLPLGNFGIIDCNPSGPTHWLNKRPNQQRKFDGVPQVKDGLPVPQMVRIRSRHEDNPTLVNPETGDYTPHSRSYMSKLDSLTGVRYKRLRQGLWVAAEGQIWENFDPAVHVIRKAPDFNCGLINRGLPQWRMVVAGIDWGFRLAGCLQVYGVDNEGRMYLLHEIYRAGVNVVTKEANEPSWLQWAMEAQKKYNPDSWQCDPAEPGFIMAFRRAGIPAKEADNDLLPGIDAVRDRFALAEDGRARLYIVANSLRERCPTCDDQRRPCGLAEEIPEYCYRLAQDGKPIKEEPDPATQDHACDTTRYITRFVDRYFTPGMPNRRGRTPIRRRAGYILGHPKEDYIFDDER